MERQAYESVVKMDNVEVGGTYPIYGMITRIISEKPGLVVVELNYNIHATMRIPELQKVELLKQRAFEPGIFVASVTSITPIIEIECSTVVFGKATKNLA